MIKLRELWLSSISISVFVFYPHQISRSADDNQISLNRDKANGNQSEPVDSAPTHWDRLLRIGGKSRINSVTLLIPKGELEWYMSTIDRIAKERLYPGVGGEINCTVATREILEIIRVGCMTPIRYVEPSKGGHGPGGARNLGSLTLNSYDGEELKIVVTNVGLVLGEGTPSSDNIFFSYGLSSAIDDMVHSNGKRHLPRSLLDILSGNSCIQQQILAVERVRATVGEQ